MTDWRETGDFRNVEIEDQPPGDLGKTKANGHDSLTWRDRLALRCAADLDGKVPRERVWLVPEWIPARHLTGLYGKGSAGKTTLGIQLCCASAMRDGHWLGMPVRKSRPFAFLCEDDEDEIERKVLDASRTYGHRRANYQDFQYLSRFGEDNLLFARGRAGLITTGLYDDLCQLVADERRDFLLFDGIADIYGLNINDQGEVVWALSKLLAMAKPTRATVLLLGHPNKAGTSEFTGSAAWENKPRARLYLGPVKQDADGEPDANDPRRLLSRSKANLAGKDAITIAWADGAFRVADARLMSMAERCELEAREAAACTAFLDGLDTLTRQRRHTSHSEHASNFAPKLMMDGGLGNGFTRKELTRAMNRLFEVGRIKAQQELWRGPDRHVVVGVATIGCGKVDDAEP